MPRTEFTVAALAESQLLLDFEEAPDEESLPEPHAAKSSIEQVSTATRDDIVLEIMPRTLIVSVRRNATSSLVL